jgi:hypothetical protein
MSRAGFSTRVHSIKVDLDQEYKTDPTSDEFAYD